MSIQTKVYVGHIVEIRYPIPTSKDMLISSSYGDIDDTLGVTSLRFLECTKIRICLRRLGWYDGTGIVSRIRDVLCRCYDIPVDIVNE